MLTIAGFNILQASFFLAYYGLVYLLVRKFVHVTQRTNAPVTSKPEVAELPPQQPDSTVSDPVLQADSEEFTEKESVLDLVNSSESYDPDECDYTPVPYRHELWPSPRPVNFVNAIMEYEPDFKPRQRRLAHVNAVDILAERAFMTRREFLRTNPLTYSDRYMKGMNALYLLKDSIDHLESMLRNDLYRQDLRRVENGKITCRY